MKPTREFRPGRAAATAPWRLIRLASLALALGAIVTARGASTTGPPLVLRPGPQLLIDDFLIAHQEFLTRTVVQPTKRAEPVITGAGGDDNFQPYLTVLQDPSSKRYRAWYNTPVTMEQSHLAYLESVDAIHWQRPYRLLADPMPIRFGASVIDRGPDFVPAAERFALGFYQGDGLRIAVSQDGLGWRMLRPGTVLAHNHDIDSIHWDPIRRQYIAIVSVLQTSPQWQGRRRIPYESVSRDLIAWEPMWPIIMPKIGAPLEQGETEFYAMSGLMARGDLLIGLVKVLRDDLNATPGRSAQDMGDLNRKAAGLGYTVLAWTRDGARWQRDAQPFLANTSDPARWDHAMAWGDDQITAGDRTLIYYAGYHRGHKVARNAERQFGVAEMPLDRYVAREADLNIGTLLTPPLVLQAASITINANVIGEMAARLLDENAVPIEGYDWSPIRGDSVHQSIRWGDQLTGLGGRPVRLEFRFREAQLFGFTLR
jgi:hypothetical protein